MRVASIIAEDLSSAQKQIKIAAPVADIIELRLDYWQTLNLQEVAQLRHEVTVPIIFTLRKPSQGGHFKGSEEERLSLINQLATLSPEYLDLEFDVDLDWALTLHAQYPSIQLIRSYHDFKETPEDLEPLFERVYHPAFSLYKMAVYANNICDTLRFLIFLRTKAQKHRVIGMAMGEYGQVSRILAPVVGSEFSYGSIDTENTAAPGQLTLEELTTIYRVQTLNRDTAIYALLGDPVVHSRGHIFHNAAFPRLEQNAVYVKLRVDAAVLHQAMQLLRQLPFAGFSITMPHKETIVPFVDRLADDAKAIGIINTIKRQGNLYYAFNTDSRAGAVLLHAKLGRLHGQNILILGAGGSAKAIAFALLSEGAQVTLCNRTLQRAQDFNREHGGDCLSFAALFTLTEFPFTAVINTLPGAAYAEQCENWVIPKPQNSQLHVAMDIVYSFSKDLNQASITPFLEMADHAGWECISGDKFFNEQALQQLQIWFV
ncbi:MAG TPA: type I 3-dehydroquinate dehydratase [Gammaproteobacteria bacterium]|nr:type I 3-dehydroquinate dehydratase [Gammaproteobacteria bacterium]